MTDSAFTFAREGAAPALRCGRCPQTRDSRLALRDHLVSDHKIDRVTAIAESQKRAEAFAAAAGGDSPTAQSEESDMPKKKRACKACGQTGHRRDSDKCPKKKDADPAAPKASKKKDRAALRPTVAAFGDALIAGLREQLALAEGRAAKIREAIAVLES